MLEALGFRPHLVADCGVAGVHRLLAEADELAGADAVVVVAGMEGALASLVGGLTAGPGGGRPHQRRLRRGPRGGHRPAGHAGLVRLGDHRGRASTTASAPPARWPGCCRDAPRAGGTRPVVAGGEWPGRPAPTVAWFHCFAGIAGDMALGSLLDAGADLDEVLGLLRAAPARRVGADGRGGAARRHRLHPGRGRAPTTTPVVRTHAHIADLVDRGPAARAGDPAGPGRLRRPGRGRGRLHRRPPRPGALPRGRGARRHHRRGGHGGRPRGPGVDEVAASAVATGTGTVRTAHGLLPNPAPAVVRLLQGAPTYGRDTAGRADHAHRRRPAGRPGRLASGRCPPMAVTATGFGAGQAELDDLPNCTQVVVGRATAAGRRRAAASRSPCSRPTSTTSPASSWPTPWPRCSRPGPTTPGPPRSS